jgi:hypothetical protein
LITILAVSRDDQINALKIQALKREFTIREVVLTLTTFKPVTRNQLPALTSFATCDERA